MQIVLASILLMLSTGVAWYEGSTILQEPWEWKHSAVFSQMANGQVGNPNDILTIDYFVYAAKFAPAFPVLMLISGTYLMILLGIILLKRNDKAFSYFLVFIGVLFLSLSGFLSNSPTSGLKIFFYSCLAIGIFSIAFAVLRFFTSKTERNFS